ncbi:tetratricopeptide repeat protein [Thermospira aquatica]|uniref:Tetratricopeptide repeat protein n=1 Tax=Thermospira aquatica TaxID=2828656 RepID=A0AAX3BFP9_9SPIR|nr:hypothetical protein [Thermospira aquatica]URA10968.1 hypothetical protein KDW03_03965 [Thermospira aquatica]
MNRKNLFLFLCGMSLFVFGTSSVSIEEATAQYIYSLYQKHRYTDVTVEVRNFLSRYPLSSLYIPVAIIGGEAAYKDKNYNLGRYFFEQAFKKAKQPHQVKQSLLGMAKCSYKLGLYQEAAKLFESYAREFDDPVVTPAVLYYAQVCALAANDQENAQRYQQWHASRYPESPYLSLLASASSRDTSFSIEHSVKSSPEEKEQKKESPPLNEVSFSMPSSETSNTILLTNWVVVTTTNTFTNEKATEKEQTLALVEENNRYLSLLEVKAKLLQLKARALDDELSELGIGGLE